MVYVHLGIFFTCCLFVLYVSRTRLLQFALESPPISPVSSTSKKVVVKVHNVEATQYPVKQGNRLMDKFLIRETGDCVSELLGKENERKFSPQKEISTSADVKETSLLGKTALGLSDASGPVTPSTSTLKLDTKGRKSFLYLPFILKEASLMWYEINRQHF